MSVTVSTSDGIGKGSYTPPGYAFLVGRPASADSDQQGNTRVQISPPLLRRSSNRGRRPRRQLVDGLEVVSHTDRGMLLQLACYEGD